LILKKKGEIHENSSELTIRAWITSVVRSYIYILVMVDSSFSSEKLSTNDLDF